MEAVDMYDKAASDQSVPRFEKFKNIQLASVAKNQAYCYRKLMENFEFADFHK